MKEHNITKGKINSRMKVKKEEGRKPSDTGGKALKSKQNCAVIQYS